MFLNVVLPLVCVVWQVSCQNGPSYTPTGTDIQIQLALSDGSTGYLTNDLTGDYHSFSYSNTVANAQVFTLDPFTGYLFLPTTDTATYSSGYAALTVRIAGISDVKTEGPLGYWVQASDGTAVVNGNNHGVTPLKCK